MIHFDDGVLRAWLDRELAAERGREVGAHLDGCLDCRARVRELKRAEDAVHHALALLDGPVPGESAWARVSAGLASGGRRSGGDPTPGTAGSPAFFAGTWARAAGFVLLLGGGLAAAVIPGSPLRSLWAPTAAPEPVPASSAAAVDAPERAGIRAAEAGGAVRVDLRGPAGTTVEVVLTGERAGVFGPPSSSFSAGEGWLRAEFAEGPVRVELPASGATARIEINGTAAVTFDGGRLVRAPDHAVAGDGDVRLRFDVR